MKKVIVINGAGGSGKDSFVKLAKGEYAKGGLEVFNYSSVDPVRRDLRKHYGWDGKDKSDAWRNKMVQLKQIYTTKDLPTQYLLRKVNQIADGVIFLHIREPEEIDKLKKLVPEAHTLHISRPQARVPETTSDLRTEEYEYDTNLVNDGETLDDLKRLVIEFFENTLPKVAEFEREIQYKKLDNEQTTEFRKLNLK